MANKAVKKHKEIQFKSDVTFNDDGTVEYKFPTLFKGHGRDLESIILKRFTVQDMDDVRDIKDPYEKTRELMIKSTGLADNEITLLDAKSYSEISDIVSDFM